MPCNCGKNKRIISNQLRNAQNAVTSVARTAASRVTNAARNMGAPAVTSNQTSTNTNTGRVRVRAKPTNPLARRASAQNRGNGQ